MYVKIVVDKLKKRDLSLYDSPCMQEEWNEFVMYSEKSHMQNNVKKMR